MAMIKKRIVYDVKKHTKVNNLILPKGIVGEFKKAGFTIDEPYPSLIEDLIFKYYKQYLTLLLSEHSDDMLI